MAVAHPDEINAQSPRLDTIEELFGALESPLLRYAWRLLGDFESAEDVVQDAFMKLHTQGNEVREPRRWLYRTVHNLALNRQRHDGRNIACDFAAAENPLSVSDRTDPQPLPDEQIARWERIGLVQLSLQTLDTRSRELVRLKFEEDLSYKEMSERTGLTVGHVGYLLHFALRTIADELAKTGAIS